MDKQKQIDNARRFLALHHDPKLLVLPNIWDPLGARMLEVEGYPAVATASAAVAYSLGHDDGENITFDTMLEVIRRIADRVEIPVSADIESGYAEEPDDVARNIERVIETGAVGINIEDGTFEGGPLRPVAAQCDRIRAARRAADGAGIPLVINARLDVFIRRGPEDRATRVTEAIERGIAYREAGADCLYPITAGDIETLARILDETPGPLNVYATPTAAPMRELEAAGIARLSLGPWLLKASLTRMRKVARALKNYGTYDVFANEAISSDTIARYVSRKRGPQ